MTASDSETSDQLCKSSSCYHPCDYVLGFLKRDLPSFVARPHQVASSAHVHRGSHSTHSVRSQKQREAIIDEGCLDDHSWSLLGLMTGFSLQIGTVFIISEIARTRKRGGARVSMSLVPENVPCIGRACGSIIRPPSLSGGPCSVHHLYQISLLSKNLSLEFITIASLPSKSFVYIRHTK